MPREHDTQIPETDRVRPRTLLLPPLTFSQVKYPIDSLAAYHITRQFGPYLELDHLSNGQLSTVCNAADLNGCVLETPFVTR